ncbi:MULTISPECIES: WD40 repeat domain-containing protein [Halorussus]|uniref:WD40/YVTN/BNR-like repeat-containing protein n=1 Tax=Halorussus TaxID=1070314 RepID=UPI000E20DFAE|nr:MULTISPECIES: WD40 repeat domain-containing protein [Halorussus]NHN58022.1 WD40 repeat domain-containing protein [Halorussus sp. JP-T4]
MLVAGSTDGIYRIDDILESEETTAEKVRDADDVFRVRQFDGLEGLFAAAASGLYHSLDGTEWRALPVPAEQVYAVAAGPSGDRLYAGTRPADLYAADTGAGAPTDGRAWEPVTGFRDLRERSDWGIPRHDGVSQVRSLRTHPDAPDRLVAGIEVGGVFVSDDAGSTWTSRRIEGFDARHTDDVHHLAIADAGTFVASTGSGLYRTTDAGRTWDRLDAGHAQRYFREAFVRDGTVFAGGAPASSSSWDESDDHALFESRDGERLERVAAPTSEEVAVGWCAVEGDPVAATHRGRLIRRRDDGWTGVGAVPVPGDAVVRYLPLTWYEP